MKKKGLHMYISSFVAFSAVVFFAFNFPQISQNVIKKNDEKMENLDEVISVIEKNAPVLSDKKEEEKIYIPKGYKLKEEVELENIIIRRYENRHKKKITIEKYNFLKKGKEVISKKPYIKKYVGKTTWVVYGNMPEDEKKELIESLGE